MFPPRVTNFSTRINQQGMLTGGARLIRVGASSSTILENTKPRNSKPR